VSGYFDDYIELAEQTIDSRHSVPARARGFTSPAPYALFLTSTTLLALFFAVSFVYSLASPYFLDWPSALVGFIGTAGLALVGWASKLQLGS